MKRYKINEIFGPTIQGEGSFAGVPVAFVRFSGCNRKCDFCDTDFDKYEELTSFDIVRRINNLGLGFKIVVLTGGEPTLQLDDELCSMLSLRWNLHLETNGSNFITSIEDYFEHISCSPKQSPDETRCSYHDIKLIWPYQDNYTISDYEAPHCCRFIQPIHGHDVVNDKELMSELYRTDSRLSFQAHKFLGLK